MEKLLELLTNKKTINVAVYYLSNLITVATAIVVFLKQWQ